MICKNCGAQLPDNSAFCGNCGIAVEADSMAAANMGKSIGDSGGFIEGQNPANNFAPNPNMPQNNINGVESGFDFNAPADGTQSTPKNTKKIVIISCIAVASLLLICAIGFGLVRVMGSKPETTIDRFMESYMKCDGAGMNKEISKTYKQALVYTLETYDLLMDGQIKNEAGGNIDEYVEKLFTEKLESVSKEFFDEFEYKLGSGYEANYVISAKEEVSSDDLKKFNEIVTRLSKKEFKMDGLMLSDIEVTGKSGTKEYDNRFTLFLCKDGTKWYVVDIYDYGYSFDDFYSGLSLDDLENIFDN